MSGDDIASIHQSLQRHGPLGENGKKFHASTRWQLDWNYRWIESAKVCRLNGIEVSVDIDMLLPKLKNRQGLNESLGEKWDRYLSALTAHEERHKEFGLQAARELEQVLLNTPAQDCFALENRLSQQARDVLDKYERQEKEYDRKTNHGINEGVSLQ